MRKAVSGGPLLLQGGLGVGLHLERFCGSLEKRSFLTELQLGFMDIHCNNPLFVSRHNKGAI